MIIEILTIVVLFSGFYLIEYVSYWRCFADDVEFRYGRKHMRNSRKKNKNRFEKFFFLDVKNKVSKWHYICFWVNFVSFFPLLISVIIYAVNDSSFVCPTDRSIHMANLFVHFFTSFVGIFAHWPLYRGNVIRNRKKYRRKYMSTRKK